MVKRKATDEDNVGKLPIKGDVISEEDLVLLRRTYNYHFNLKDHADFLKKYIVANYDGVYLRGFNSLDYWKVKIPFGWIADMIMRKCVVDDSLKLRLIDYIDSFKEIGKNVEEVKQTETVKIYKPSKYSMAVAELDEIEDGISESKSKVPPNLKEIINSHELSSIDLTKLNEKYTGLLDEITSKEPDFVEAYSKFPKSYMNLMASFYKILIELTSQNIENKKRQRKTRVKRPRSADKIVAKVKYMKKDEELNVQGLSPINIIGKKEAWIYNSKTRTVFHYVADRELSFKGTTLQHFNENASVSKTVRKPENIIPIMASSGKRKIEKMFKELTTKEKQVNIGRIGSDHLILKAF